MPAVNLKVSIMSKFIAISVLYFGFELVINGLIPSVELAAKQTTTSSHSQQGAYDPWEEVIQQYYDLFIVVCLLIVFRARSLPDYFTVGLFDGEIGDIAMTNEQLVEQYKVVPLFSALIDRKVLHSGSDAANESFDGSLNRSFAPDENIVVLNPCDISTYSTGSSQMGEAADEEEKKGSY